MPVIQGKNLYIEHPNKTRDILTNVSFHITPNSKIGLIGENGSGKTTLLSLIQGKYKNFKGDLNYYFQTENQISTVVQEIKETHLTLEEYLWKDHKLFKLKNQIYSSSNSDISIFIDQFQNLGGYDFEILIDKKLEMFGFKTFDLTKKISEFSGGEKTKISIIKSVIYDCELLLFDEPVNNLDRESIEWFTSYLVKLDKPFIIVSHERDILDKCVETIWDLDNNTLNTYTANYSEYKKQKNDLIENIKSKNQNIDRQVLKLNESISQRRQKSESFENFKQKRSFKKNGGICKRDEGSGSGRLSIKKMMKGALALETRKESLLGEKVLLKKDKFVKMLLDDNTVKAKTILNIDDINIYFDNYILKNLNLRIGFNEKINISGKNGTGKSTLLKILCSLNNNTIKYTGNFNWNPQAKIAYFSQNHDNLDFNKTCFKEISDSCNKTESEIRNTLAYLDLTHDKIFNKISELSLGERAKVILSKIILSDSNVLILDEPTNHLDIKSREALETALSNFKGCIIFVSHDLYLTKKIATNHINLEDYIIYEDI